MASGYILTKSGKTVTKLVLGAVVMGVSLVLIVPSAIGVAEYNSRPLPVAGGIVDSDKQNTLNTYKNIQIAVLVIACVGVFIGVYLMATSRVGKKKLENAQYSYNRLTERLNPMPQAPAYGRYTSGTTVNAEVWGVQKKNASI